MRTSISILKKYIFAISAICLFTLVSCKNDDDKGVRIDSVWTNQLDQETKQISSSYTGLWIRLKGSGFGGLQKILCNGKPADFNPVYITNNYIIFVIPNSVPLASEVDESIANTIQVVTSHGKDTYNQFVFKDKNRMPSVSKISYTMPVPGEVITLTGKNLMQVDEVYFPATTGEVQATEYTKVSDTQITVTVPSGVGDKSGAIRVVAIDESFFSPAYMFYNEGVFMRDFTEVATGTSSKTAIYSDPTQIANLTGLTNNPEYVLAIPPTPENVAIASNNNTFLGYFRFLGAQGIQNVIDNSNNSITASSDIVDLAIQFDLYMPNPWTSGAIVLKMNKDNTTTTGSMVRCLTQWPVAGSYTFNGWETVTINFADFKGLTLGTLGAYVNTLVGTSSLWERQAFIAFSNFDCNNDGHTPSAMTDFQFFVANVRLVPTTIPTE